MTNPASKLDRIDLSILVRLQAEGQLTNVELAQKVGLSASPCLQRVKRLEAAGLIAGYGACLNLAKLTDMITVFTEVTLKNWVRVLFLASPFEIRHPDFSSTPKSAPMPRLTRLLYPGVATHVIQRGNNRQAIFFDDEDREQYLTWLGEALRAEACRLHAYVLMSNHVHLLVTGAAAQAIPRVLQSLGRRYVARVNRLRGRTGTLWEGRYKSTLIDSDRYLLACYRYIEANPIRAGMVARPEQHPWSSWRRNGFGEADPLITPHPLYDALGPDLNSRAEAYRALFEQGLDLDTLATLRDATQRGWLPGEEKFREAMSATLNRPTGPRSRGRPRRKSGQSENLKIINHEPF